MLRSEDAQKTVTISIDGADLADLKANDSAMCFARKVDGTYNVVWQSFTDFFGSTTFSWTPQYALFGSDRFVAGVAVEAATNVVTLGLGEEATLDENGNLGNPVSGGPAMGITLINEFGPVHPSLSGISSVDGDPPTAAPLYVAEDAADMGSIALTPIDTVMVWFEPQVTTSTMFSDPKSNAIEIDLTRTDAGACLYQHGMWVASP